MQIIYFKKRILSICGAEEIPAVADESILLRPDADYDLSKIPFMMEDNLSFQHLIVEIPSGMSEEVFMDKMLSGVKKINAGGGLVADKDGNWLMIYRNGTWDLPKGMQEEGENIAVTAAVNKTTAAVFVFVSGLILTSCFAYGFLSHVTTAAPAVGSVIPA